MYRRSWHTWLDIYKKEKQVNELQFAHLLDWNLWAEFSRGESASFPNLSEGCGSQTEIPKDLNRTQRFWKG